MASIGPSPSNFSVLYRTLTAKSVLKPYLAQTEFGKPDLNWGQSERKNNLKNSDFSTPCVNPLDPTKPVNIFSSGHFTDLSPWDTFSLDEFVDNRSSIDDTCTFDISLFSECSLEQFCPTPDDILINETSKSDLPWCKTDKLNPECTPLNLPVFPTSSTPQSVSNSPLHNSSQRRRKTTHVTQLVDIDESDSVMNSVNLQVDDGTTEGFDKAQKGFESVIALALSSSEASDFDLPELHDAFLSFFEKGEVSPELDSYFSKVLASEGLECSADENAQPHNPDDRGRTNGVYKNSISKYNCAETSSSINYKAYYERRIRNNEASRRSRAASKARFRELMETVERMRFEKQELVIWLRQVRLAISDAKRTLSRARIFATTDISLHHP